MISASRVREIFKYDDVAGRLVWVKNTGVKKKIGELAGGINKVGYRTIGVDGSRYTEHRLIWLYVYGSMVERIDHVDGDKTNNLIKNLRAATNSENLKNRGKQANNNSGFKGVSFFKRDGTWKSSIASDGVQYHLGYFSTPELAARAYDDATRRLHGEFAQVNFP